MKEFDPPINERTNEELILIVYSEKGEWQEAAVELAINELQKRGVSKEEQESIFNELKIYWQQQLNEEIENRKTESFSIIEIFFMVFFWPRELLSNWTLKKEGFDRKHKQRLFFISLGVLLWILFIGYVNTEEVHKESVQRGTANDSVELVKSDWSGLYKFYEPSFGGERDILWELQIDKFNQKHSAYLIITDSRKTILEIDCDAVISKKMIEFFPDSVIKNKTANNFEYFDELFRFEVFHDDTIVVWNKIKPLSINNFYNGYPYFKKQIK